MSDKLQIRRGAELEFIAADEEEPFTMETFGTLLEQHWSKGKSMIIARVETADSTKPFYYAAHHLNKVLFRRYGEHTQYLFRLYALNPLTNTEIESDVEYFEFKPRRAFKLSSRSLKQPAKALKEMMQQSIGSSKKQLKIQEITGTIVPVDVPQFRDLQSSLDSLEDTSTSKLPQSPSFDSKLGSSIKLHEIYQSTELTPNIDTQLRISTERLADDQSQGVTTLIKKHKLSPLVQDLPEPDIKHQYAYGKFIGTDDTFMQKAKLRELFNRNSLTEEDAYLFEMPEDVLIHEGIFPPGFNLDFLSDPDFIVALQDSLAGDAFPADILAKLEEEGLRVLLENQRPTIVGTSTGRENPFCTFWTMQAFLLMFGFIFLVAFLAEISSGSGHMIAVWAFAVIFGICFTLSLFLGTLKLVINNARRVRVHDSELGHTRHAGE